MQIVRRLPSSNTEILANAGIHPVLARIFAARGITQHLQLESSLLRLPSHALLKGSAEMADRLARAIRAGERLLIVADYDADGATACAVGLRGLRSMGAVVDYLVPNRFEYGYGLTPEIVALAAKRNPAIIITVDNGIASVDGVAAARALGIETLITDHHLPGQILPAPAIIVNPNQPGCTFPSKHLAGVGVMFYVLMALRAHLRETNHFVSRPEPNLASLLDLVALGTVADVVRLDHLNRILVEQGLRRMRAGRAQAGVKALFAVARRSPENATAYDLGFVLGPRLNAAGRLADMSIGIACLTTDEDELALSLAGNLDNLNRERREVEAVMHAEALESLEHIVPGEAFTLCVFQPEWHQGVVGIVASRLKERFHRPAIVFARASNNEASGEDGELRGSGRAINGFHLRDALDLVAKREPGLLLRFGGHAFAAGLSLKERDLSRFARAFEQVASETLSPAQLNRFVESDGSLLETELSLDLAEEMHRQVWGQGFPPPLFDDHFEVLEQRPVGAKHLRLILRVAKAGVHREAIVFNQEQPLPAYIHAAYRPDVHQYQGLVSLQIIIEHWTPTPGEAVTA